MVTDGGPAEPPSLASAHQQIARWRHSGRYKHETVAALAGLLFGETIERLSRDQLRELALSLEFAVRGRVAQRTLGGAISRLSKRDNREETARALRAWLIEKANERELLGQRKAA